LARAKNWDIVRPKRPSAAKSLGDKALSHERGPTT
jgi:hypothetical protein